MISSTLKRRWHWCLQSLVHKTPLLLANNTHRPTHINVWIADNNYADKCMHLQFTMDGYTNREQYCGALFTIHLVHRVLDIFSWFGTRLAWHLHMHFLHVLFLVLIHSKLSQKKAVILFSTKMVNPCYSIIIHTSLFKWVFLF